MRFLLCTGILVFLFYSSTQSSAAETKASYSPLKIGFIMNGPVSDMGWNYLQDKGRRHIDSVFGKRVETIYIENVPENGQVERVAEKLIVRGCKLIFATAFGYLEPILRVAARHPDIIFMQAGRFDTRKNVGVYLDYPYEPMYINGIVAAQMTKTHKFGFIAAHPVPPVLQMVNAFTLGARSVNRKINVTVVWTNTWSDSIVEAEAAKSLIDSGVDTLAFCQGNPVAIVKTAEKNHKFVVGSYTDVRQFAPKQWLTGGVLNWGPLYDKVVQSVLDHTWKSKISICDIASGAWTLASFGPQVQSKIQKEALELEKKIASKKLVVFRGPLRDRDGRERLAEGKDPDFKWLANMDFLVPGVQGSMVKNKEIHRDTRN